MCRFGMVALFLLFATGAPAQGVQGIHPETAPLQVGVGFTFLSFHEVPTYTANNAGFTASVLYRRDRLGVEGELSDAFGSQSGSSSHVLFAGGGARFYMPDFGMFRPWTHAEIGYSRLSISSASNRALGYKLGGGLDFNPHHSRIEYRISADVFGSTFFNTYQISPEVSVGLIIPLGHS